MHLVQAWLRAPSSNERDPNTAIQIVAWIERAYRSFLKVLNVGESLLIIVPLINNYNSD